ncbi:MAG TPA: citrate synthase [Stellaceae bacterium]|nr:citrate synthase [Stellaceae bacterium]
MRGGLEGVVVAETVMSHADGETGEFWIRGHTLPELIARHGYEGTVAILWQGFAGDGLTRGRIARDLGAARSLASSRLGDWLGEAAKRPIGEALRLSLAMLPEESEPAAILGAFPVAIAAWLRRARGQQPVAPDAALGTAADLLRMIADAPADPRQAEALDAYFTTIIENGLNASSFAARIIASSRASLVSAVLGAYCAFTGPLHGGAPGPTLDMLEEIERAGDRDAWFEKKLAAGERLMGFGHRVFADGDPRGEALAAALRRLGREDRLAFAAEVEARAAAAFARLRPGRELKPNVEIYAALLLEAVGLPREAFTPVFALARAAGWLGHAMEQRQTARYIRPSSVYVGPKPSPNPPPHAGEGMGGGHADYSAAARGRRSRRNSATRARV